MTRLQIVNGITLALAGLITAAGVAQADVPAAGERTSRASGVTVTKRVFRLTRFDGGRVLQATGRDGTEYQIVLTAQPAKDLVNLSALQPGDRLIIDGAVRDGAILANRLEMPVKSRMGRVAAVPLR